MDLSGIPPSAEWRSEIEEAIDAATAFVFLISPESAASAVCREELQHAEALNKRLVGVLIRPVPANLVPEAISARHWINFERPKEFDRPMRELVTALTTDLDWRREHARLTVKAREWETSGRDSAFVLRGRDLEAAERRLAEADEQTDPQPNRLQTEHVLASRATARRAQRIRTGLLTAALVVALGLAAVALIQRNRAEDQAKDARSRELAAKSLLAAASNPDLSLVLAVEAAHAAQTPEAEQAIRAALETPRADGVLRGHDGPVNSAAWNIEGSLVVTSSDDGTARLWDPATMETIEIVDPPGSAAMLDAQLSPTDGGLAVADEEGIVQLWRLRERPRMVSELGPGGGPIVKIAFDASGRLLAAATADGTARIWRVATGKLVSRLKGSSSQLYAVAFAPNGRQVVTGGADGSLRLWDLRSETVVSSAIFGAGGQPNEATDINSVAFTASGDAIVAGGQDGAVRVWDAGLANRTAAFRVGNDEVYAVAAAAPTWVAAAGLDGTAKVWEQATNRGTQGRVRVLPPHTTLRGAGEPLNSVALSPDGRRAVTAGEDHLARLWPAQGDESLAVYGRHHPDAHLTDVAAAPMENLIVTAADDCTSRVWRPGVSPRTLTVLAIQVASERACYRNYLVKPWAANFSPDGRFVITANERDHPRPNQAKALIRVWEVASGDYVYQRDLPGAAAYDAAFSPDGALIAAVGAAGIARVWNAEQRTRVADLGRTDNRPDSELNALAFSPDSRFLAVASQRGTITVWDLERKERVRVVRGAGQAFRSVAFSPDGNRLLGGGEDGTVTVWDARSEQPVARLRGHTSSIEDLDHSPDGDLLVTASTDRTARIWDADSGVLLDVLRGNRASLNGAAFTFDGGLVVTGALDASARVFSCRLCIPFEEVLGLAEDLLNVLSPEELAAYRAESA